MFDARNVLDEQDLSRLLLALLVKSTSPRRRTPPFRQTSSATFAYAANAPLLSLRDIFPVSSGELAPKGKASKKKHFTLKKTAFLSFFDRFAVFVCFFGFFNALNFVY